MRQIYWEICGLGVDLVAASNSTPESNQELRERLDLPFTLLSDTNADVARAYRAYHENEPRGRDIALASTFIIDTAEHDNRILWDHVGPTSRHRVTPTRLIEELLNALGYQHQVVSVMVPSQHHLESIIAALQEPPLGLYRTPEEIVGPSVTERDFTRQLAMASYNDLHRLPNQGWRLVGVTPEFDGSVSIGQRYVFERSLPIEPNGKLSG